MKKFFYATLCVVSLCLSGCGYDDDEVWNAINDQEERIAALEEWQKTANENIAALQAIVNGNDYITSVEEIKEGDEIIGYTINFHRQGEVTIYNGKDGEKGDMPVIGVSEGEDGRWYWTVNGELLEDADGNPVCANGKDGEDGEDGEDGSSGSNGSSAPIPQVKTENGEVYLSVDGGATWHKISGTDTSGCDCFIENIVEEDDYYWFEFADDNGIMIPKYEGSVDLIFRQPYNDEYGRKIENGKCTVDAGDSFGIECTASNWTYEIKENAESWRSVISREENALKFESVPEGSVTIVFSVVEENNKVTYYQVTITASKKEEVIIEKTENAELAEALAGIGVGTTNEEGDIVLTQEDITNTTSLDLSNRNLNNLEGLEVFENVTTLNCSNNPLTSLDVSAFSELRELNCDNCFNQSASRSYSNGVLDLSENTKLQTLSCANNGLTSLILPDTQTLYWINCSSNRLTTLDVSKNPVLDYLSCMNNQLTMIDVSKNTALTFLELDDNQLTTLDITQNVLLETLWVPRNKLTALDVSSNEALNRLFCNENQLVQLDISNNVLLQGLGCGNQRTADNAEQKLILVLNESQQQLWESTWENDNYNVVVSERADVARNLFHGMEYGQLSVVLRPEPYQAGYCGDKDPAVAHAVDISHPVSIFERIAGKVLIHGAERFAVGIGEHGESPSVCAEPHPAIPVLRDRIDVVRAD